MYSRSAKGGEKGDPNRNPWLAKMHTYMVSGKSWVRGQTKDNEIGMCCFSAKHTELMRKCKDWLARNQNNVSDWSHMSNRWLLFQ
jgi:hypothetical protein